MRNCDRGKIRKYEIRREDTLRMGEINLIIRILEFSFWNRFGKNTSGMKYVLYVVRNRIILKKTIAKVLKIKIKIQN